MSVTLSINRSVSEEERYISLLPQIEALLNPEEPLVSNFANVTAALKEAFEKISWVGFYFLKDDNLFLGPFQGKIACTVIKIGNGVCGTAAKEKETIIVEDVEKFPGHIACDSSSRSEIVVPIIMNENIFGVLDLDSYKLSAFGEIDKIYLQTLCKLITNKFTVDQLRSII